MAKSHVYLIISILVMASLSSPSHGLTILGYSISRVIIEEVLYCRLNGTSSPVSNATVFLTCGGSTLSLAEAVTDTNGLFRIVLSYLQTILFNPSFCGLGLNLPVGNCGIVVPETALSAPLTLAYVIHNNTINTAVYTANLVINATG